MRKDPLILLGMHRSGTTMLAELLSSVGMFLGSSVGAYHETIFFRKLNQHILEYAHANWDNPSAFHKLMENKDLEEGLIRFLNEKLESMKFRKQYTGLFKAKKFEDDTSLVWGWKDPRTTITFPIWNKIMPEAKYLFIVRNGIDVASSLYVREKAIPVNVGKKNASVRCYTMQGAFSLWEEYHAIHKMNHAHVNPAKVMTVRYEDFLENSATVLKDICEFAGLKSSSDIIDKTCLHINPKRSYAFVKKPELEGFYNERKDSEWMTHYKYNKIL